MAKPRETIKQTTTYNVKSGKRVTMSITKDLTPKQRDYRPLALPVFVLLTWMLIFAPFFGVMTTISDARIILADEFTFRPSTLFEEFYYQFDGVNDWAYYDGVNDSNFEFFIEVDNILTTNLIGGEVFQVLNNDGNGLNGWRLSYFVQDSELYFLSLGNSFSILGDIFVHTINLQDLKTIRIVANNGTTQMYVNGNLVQTGSQTFQFNNPRISIGRYRWIGAQTPNEYFGFDLINFTYESASEDLDIINHPDDWTFQDISTISTQLGLPARDYYDVMENARTAEYGNPFEFINQLLRLPQYINNFATGIDTALQPINQNVVKFFDDTMIGRFAENIQSWWKRD